MEIQELIVKISADASEMQSSINGVLKSFSGLRNTASKVEKNFGNVGKAAKDSLNGIKSAVNGINKPMSQLNLAIDRAIKDYRKWGAANGIVKHNIIDVQKLTKAYQDLANVKLPNKVKYLGEVEKFMYDMRNGPADKFNQETYDYMATKAANLRMEIAKLNGDMKQYEAILDGVKGKSGQVFMADRILELRKKLGEVNAEIERHNKKFEEARMVYEGAKETLKDLEAEYEKLNTSTINRDNYQIFDKMIDENYIKNLKSSIAETKKDMASYKAEMDKAQESMDAAGAKAANLEGELGAATSASGALSAALSSIGVAGVVAISAAAAAIAVVVAEIVAGVKAVKQIIKYTKSAVNVIGEVTRKLGSFLWQLNPFPRLLDRIGNSISTIFNRIKTTLLRQTISRALNSIRETLTSYLETNDEVMASLKSLRGAWLTAFQPIYNAVIPILVTLMNYLTMVGRAVAAFFSMLTGKSVSSFAAQAKNLYDTANGFNKIGEEAEGAGGAAEEAKKTLAGFDELEVLQDKSSGGGGAGGIDAEDYGVDWEGIDGLELPKFNSWGEAFSALLDKILEKLPKLHEWLMKAADAINKFFSNLKEMFTFDGVLEKVSKIATELAEMLNDFVNRIDWKTMGEAIGAGLNLVIQFLKDFIYTFDWENLGKSFAEGINGMFSMINWENVGALLVAGWNIVWKTVYGFVHELDWKSLGEDISEAINGAIKNIDFASTAKAITEGLVGIFTAIETALNNIDFDAAVRKVQEFFDNLDAKSIAQKFCSALITAFKKVGPVLGEIAKGILDTLIDLVSNIDWSGIGSAIGDFINDIDVEGILSRLGKLIGQKLPNLISMIAAAIKTVDWSQVSSGIYEFFGNAIGSVDFGALIGDIITILARFTMLRFQTLADIIFGLISGLIADIAGFILGGRIEMILKAIQSVGDMIADFFRSIGLDSIAGFIDGINEKIQSVIDTLHEWVLKVVEAVKGFLGIHSPSTVFAEIGRDMINGLLMGITEVWTTITAFFTNVLGNLKTQCSQAWENIKQTATQKWTQFKTIVSDLTSNLRDYILETWENLKTNVEEKTEKLKQNVNEKWTKMKQMVETLTDDFKKKIEDKWTNMKENVSQFTENLKTFVETTWDTMKFNVETFTEDLKFAVLSKWDDMKMKVSFFTDELSTQVQEKWNTMKEKVTEFTENLKAKVEEKWKNMKENLVNAANDLKEKVSNHFNTLKSKLESTFSNLKTKLEEIWTTLKTNVVNAASDMADNLSTSLSDAASTVVSAFNTMKSKVSSVFNSIKTDITKLAQTVATKAQEIWDDITSANNANSGGWNDDDSNSGPAFAQVAAPAMASGGVVKSPTLAWVGEYSGASSNPEIVSPQSTIESIVNAGNEDLISVWIQTTRQIISAINDVDTSVVIDDNAIASSVIRSNNAKIRRTGVGILA